MRFLPTRLNLALALSGLVLFTAAVLFLVLDFRERTRFVSSKELVAKNIQAVERLASQPERAVHVDKDGEIPGNELLAAFAADRGRNAAANELASTNIRLGLSLLQYEEELRYAEDAAFERRVTQSVLWTLAALGILLLILSAGWYIPWTQPVLRRMAERAYARRGKLDRWEQALKEKSARFAAEREAFAAAVAGFENRVTAEVDRRSLSLNEKDEARRAALAVLQRRHDAEVAAAAVDLARAAQVRDDEAAAEQMLAEAITALGDVARREQELQRRTAELDARERALEQAGHG